jgi:ribonuclease HI
MVAGDLNAHHGSWDAFKPTDRLGIALENWADNAGMVCINNRRMATRYDLATGSPSTPDVTWVDHSLAERTSWTTLEDIGTDHLPIKTVIRLNHSIFEKGRPRTSWSTKKADWGKYHQVVIEELRKTPLADLGDQQLIKRFTEILKNAANQAVPRGARKNAKAWFTDEVDKALKVARVAKAEWLAHPLDEERKEDSKRAHKVASDTVKDAKSKSWEDFLSETDLRKDAGAPFRLLKSMEQPSGDSRDAALRQGTKTATDARSKAELAIKHYASVNRIHRNKKDDSAIRAEARFPKTCAPDCDYCRPFTMSELQTNLRKMGGKAAGPDGIYPWMLKHLPLEGQVALLTVCNCSWIRKLVPAVWRSATILPDPKKGKDPANIGSYRPISLTSVVCKMVERLVQGRLRFWTEKNCVLNPDQAGFRQGRSTEEAIARTAQLAMDGLNQPKMERTLLVLVDFSRAYDRVWKRGLMAKMRKQGAPACLRQWTNNFLTDRRARVLWGQARSSEKVLSDGLPQGSVISPLLWLLYMDDIKEVFKDIPGISVSLYADDLALSIRGCLPVALAALMQKAIDALEVWANKWSMLISVEKTETLLISTHPGEVGGKWNPGLTCYGKAIAVNKNPVFLGATLDASLTFGAHADKVRARVDKRVNLLRRLNGKNWVTRLSTLQQTFKAYVVPVAQYCASTWVMFAAASSVDKVQAGLNRGLRCVAGCPNGTNTAVLHAELDCLPLELQGQVLAATLLERARRMPEELPLSKAVAAKVNPRLVNRRNPTTTQTTTVTATADTLTVSPRRSCRCDLVRTQWCQACISRKKGMRCTRLHGHQNRPPEATIQIGHPLATDDNRDPGPYPIAEIVTRGKYRRNFRDGAEKMCSLSGLSPNDPREHLLLLPDQPPWVSRANVSFHLEPAWAVCKKDGPDERRRAAEAMLADLPIPDITIWTDGSAVEGTTNGGAGMVIKRGAEIIQWHAATGAVSSSFRAECCAMLNALERLSALFLQRQDFRASKVIWLCSDSLSAMSVLASGAYAQQHLVCRQIWDALESCARDGRRVCMVWVPGHAGLSGNEEADVQAELGSRLDQSEIALDFPVTRAIINRSAKLLRRKWYSDNVPRDHLHFRATAGKPLPRDPRRSGVEERALRLLRCNRHPFCRGTLARWGRTEVDGSLVDGLCGSCGVTDDSDHLLCHCIKWHTERLQLLGPLPVPILILQSNPSAVIAFCRAIGLLAPI